MSVTFATDYTPSAYAVTCSCGAATTEQFESVEDVQFVITSGNAPVCGDEFCAAYFPSIKPITDAPELNVSNANAEAILSVLGFEEIQYEGTISGDDLMGRILIAQAINPTDAGIPATRDGNFISCGRNEGYIDQRLEQLAEIAAFATKHNLSIYWG